MTRSINPTQVHLRHISRCQPGDPGAVKVGGVYFRANDSQGVSGRGGWIAGEMKPQLSDDSTATLRLANTVGADGQLHRARFACITDDRYRIGEEWVEIRREGHQLIGVFTPVTYSLSREEIQLELSDPLALTTLVREEVAHTWNASPRDVIDYYTRLEMVAFTQDFRAIDTTELIAEGWLFPNGTGGFVQSGEGLQLMSVTGGLQRVVPMTQARNQSWTLHTAIRILNQPLAACSIHMTSASSIGFAIDIGSVDGRLEVGIRSYGGFGMPSQTVALPGIATESPVDVRAWRRQEWLYLAVNGRTIMHVRAGDFGLGPVEDLTFAVYGAFMMMPSFTVTTVEPFLADPAAGDRHLPGAPTPGGLWGRYFAEPDAKSKSAGNVSLWEALCLKPTLEPVTERMDPVNFTAASPPAWQAPAVGTEWFSVRWTGAIFLDLAASNRNLRFLVGAQTRVKVWIGNTGPGAAPYLTGSGTLTGGSLRPFLGQEKAGWYPIVIEADHRSGSGGVILQDRAGGGAYSQVNTDRLSPYGVFSDTVQRESHRAMVTQITEAYGYQWVVEPRSLESGEFPGRLIPRVRQGRDTTVVITDTDAIGPEVSASVADSCDRLVVDAAGLPTIDGAGSRSAEVISPDAGDHLFLSTAYDQASEITDEQLLRQRADSLLALRAGPWEQLKVDAPGQSELVDTWPLTGEQALMRWEPGDGVRLDLGIIGQVDLQPRQLTGITWPLRPDAVGSPSITWRQRPRGARSLLLRALRSSMAAQRTYQGRIQTIDGSLGANPAPGSPTTPSILMLPTGSRIVRLELRISYPAGVTGHGKIEFNGTTYGNPITGESPIDLTHLAVPLAAGDQRIVARMTTVTTQLFEIQLSAEILR